EVRTVQLEDEPGAHDRLVFPLHHVGQCHEVLLVARVVAVRRNRPIWPGDGAVMKTSSVPAATAASLRFWMSRSTAGQSFHSTGPTHAGRFWNGGANCRAISVHSGNSA